MGYPSFLCIGAQKAGTTWLHSMLEQRPDVYMGPFKEAHFFNHKYIPEDRKWTKWHVRMGVRKAIREHVRSKGQLDYQYLRFLAELINPETMLTESWYRDIYSSRYAENKVLGDITPEYSALPADGIRFMKNYCRTPKIIYLIRDPYRRAESQIRMNVSRQKKKKWFGVDWDSVIDGTPITNRGDYRTYVERWESVFDPKDILYIPFGDVSSRPESVMRDVEKHIGLDIFSYESLSSRVHATKSARIPRKSRERLMSIVESQYPFLTERFGTDFVSRL